MTPEEVQKLLGGYATGTLTEAEQQALFEAALHDQALFDALAREQSLRDLLSDPTARASLLAGLEPRPRGFWSWRPIAAVAAMAALATIAVVVVHRPKPVLVGQALPTVNPIASSQPAVVPEPVAAAAPKVKIKRKPAAPAPVPTAPPAAVVSGAIAEAPKAVATLDGAPKSEAAAKTQEQVQVAAAAAAPLPQVVTSRTNLLAQDNAPAPRFQQQNFSQQAPMQQLRVQPPGARQIFLGTSAGFGGGARAAVARPAQPANLALRYNILRRDDSGAFVEVERSDLSPSDTVELRFTANATGYLTVGDATPVSLTTMEPYTTPPLPSMPAELKIIFAPQPQRLAPPAPAITEVLLRDTYVANRAPGQPLTFTIKLP